MSRAQHIEGGAHPSPSAATRINTRVGYIQIFCTAVCNGFDRIPRKRQFKKIHDCNEGRAGVKDGKDRDDDDQVVVWCFHERNELRRLLGVEATGDVMRRCRLRWHGPVGGKDIADYVKACTVLVVELNATVDRLNPFVLPNLEPKCAPGDPILYPESIFCHSP